MNTISSYGWTKAHQQAWEKLGLLPLQQARVVADFGTSLKIATPAVMSAELSGKLAHYSKQGDTPKVGDWVAVAISDNGTATVETVVLRSNEIARKVAGKRILKQIIAANVDIAFVLLALDDDFSVERLKRFLYQLSVHSVQAVIVLNKADKTDDVQAYLTQLKSFNLPIIVTIATQSIGVQEIADAIPAGKTALLLGSSGVGKSTLTNKLLNREAQRTNTIRASDATGKHTTVHRELFILPNGGILIDTPGVRELQLWGTEDALNTNYDDIVELCRHCTYTNCSHSGEPGCAIAEALNNGTLEAAHYENYQKMKLELVSLARKSAERIRQDATRAHYVNKKRAIRKQRPDPVDY